MTNRRLDERLDDLVIWWRENRARGRDYATQQAFLQTAIGILIDRLMEVRAEQTKANGAGDIVIPRLVGRL